MRSDPPRQATEEMTLACARSARVPRVHHPDRCPVCESRRPTAAVRAALGGVVFGLGLFAGALVGAVAAILAVAVGAGP